MAVKPTATSQEVERQQRGSGELGASFDYLQNADPTAYYYEKLKASGNQYVRDDMWSEAARRGETNMLLSNLLSSTENPYYAQWAEWEGYNDYDGYMLAMSIPNLDDTKKVDRTTTLEDGTEYSFGEFTDKEWAEKIFNEQLGRYEAVKLESDKQKEGFWKNMGDFLGTLFYDLPSRVIAGVADFFQDIYDIGEGLLNMLFNWSGDDNVGTRFLYAFSNNDKDLFENISKFFNYAAYDFERRNCSWLVNAVDAYDEGFRPGEGTNAFEIVYNSQGIGAGTTKLGQYWASATQSVGYMLPSMFIPTGWITSGLDAAMPGFTSAVNGILGASKFASWAGITAESLIKQGIFYAGVFAGNVGSTVERAKYNGTSYKDLNAGKVIANAGLKAMGQWAVETVLAGILGASKLDQFQGMKGKSAKQITSVGSKLSAAGAWAARMGKDAFKEGLEEFLQDMSDGIIDSFFGIGDSLYMDAANETLNLSNLVDSFIVGAITSFTMGAVADAKFILPKNRIYGVDEAGKAYKMGYFQTLNFMEAVKTMQEWQQTISDPNAKIDLKMDAAFKMSVAYDTLSNLFSGMGTERTIKANKILLEQAAVEATKNSAIMQMSEPKYAQTLMEDFMKAEAKASAKYVTDKVAEKVKKAAERKAKGLKDGLVTKFMNIFTKNSKVDPDIGVENNVQETVINALGKLGVEAIVGTDGNIISRSGDIVFVNNQILMEGDIKGILEGISYDSVVEAVRGELNESQKKMIVKQYNKITGTEGSLDQAITALLFDKQFYCQILLLSGERHYKMEAIKMLATIDKIIANKLAPEVQKGSITEGAFMKLMGRVQANMRAGLINFATTHCMLDLGEISNEVLSADLKEEIRQHANVQYTEFVNSGITKGELLTKQERARFIQALDKCGDMITAEQRNELIADIDSGDIERKKDAFRCLSYLTRNNTLKSSDKLVYLPTTPDNELEMVAITAVEQLVGIDWYSLLDGNIDATKFTKEFSDYMGVTYGMTADGRVNFDWSDRRSRMELLDSLLFRRSNGSFTIDINGNIMQVIDKGSFLKERYLGEKGTKNLITDIKNGKVKIIQDICAFNVDPAIGNKNIKFDASVSTRRGWYQEGSTDVWLGATGNTDTLMHELTHVTQDLLGVLDEVSTGGKATFFALLPKKTQDSIEAWLKEHSPHYYAYMKDGKVSIPQMIYFTLDGEIKARATTDTFNHDTGFTYKDNRMTLVSPDGKSTWDLTPAYNKQNKQRASTNDGVNKLLQAIQNVDKKPTKKAVDTDNNISQDLPLSKDAKDDLRDDPTTQQYMQNAWLKKKDGTPIVWYRGSTTQEYDTLSRSDNVRRLGEFYTTDYNEADMYGPTRGYITNVTRAETMVLDAKGEDFGTVTSLLSEQQKKLGQELQNQFRKFTDILKGSLDLTVNEADTEIRKGLGSNARSWDFAVTEVMQKYNLNRDQAIKFILGTEAWMDGKVGTIESIMPIAIAEGKKAIVVKNVIDGGYAPVNELVMLEPGRQKRVTFDSANVNWDEAIGKDDKKRYISNKVAAQSNLKYWIRKGIPIQIDPGVANFVIGTTAEFNKLPAVLRQKIEAGTLTKYDIIDYVSTASNMNDYTFQAIARHVFKNEEVAKIKFKDMIGMFDNIEQLAAMAYIVEDPTAKHTPAQMNQLYKATMQEVDRDKKLGDKYIKATNKAQTVKLGKQYIESHADTKQLNSAFFRHYDGNFSSLRDVNNLGKFLTAMQQDQQLVTDADGDTKIKSSGKQWNWKEKMRKADIDYEADDVSKTLDAIDRVDKINTIKNYISEVMSERVQQMSPEQLAELRKDPKKLMDQMNKQFAELEGLSDSEINKRYLAAIGAESMDKSARGIEGQIKPGEQKTNERTTKNRKDRIRNLGKTISQRIAGLKRRYNSLSETTKQYIDPKTYKLNAEYRNLSDAELDNLIHSMAEDAKKLRENIARADMARAAAAKAVERADKLARKNVDQHGKEITDPKTKTTIREKIQVQYKVTVKEQQFEFVTPRKSNQVVNDIINTQFSKQAMSQVQGLSNNTEQNVTSGKEFFEKNASTFLNATVADIEEAALWFLDTKMNNVGDEEYKKYQAVKLFFLSYVLSQAKQGGVYEGLNNNIKQRIENALKTDVTAAGTTLSAWNQMLDQIDPMRSFVNQDIEIDGVKLTLEEKTKLFDAIMSNDVEKIRQAQMEIYKSVASGAKHGQSIFRRILAFRSMAMLSSPMTALRNKVSNMALKRIYKVAEKIGNAMFKGKHVEGQLRLDKQVTPEIQNFINEHFIDNKLFDTFVAQLSKYNPSDISERFKNADGKATKEAIMSQLVLKAMYSEYYNQEMFKSPLMKQLHEKLMQMLSDNNYVREAAVRTFGKMLAEKGYNLSKNEVTDSIMNDFSTAIGMAMSDYMHSDNLFNLIEKKIGERTELGHFAYKLLMPYAASSWNWFKAMIKLSPFGLARSIYNMYKLEQNVAKQQTAYLSGKSQVSGELAEYIARRDLGQGVIGTIAWGVGMLLAGLGFVSLDDDDYGKPKLRIGNLKIDVSSIFGSSSLLAGAALVTQIQKNGLTLDGFVKGLDSMVDVWLGELPIMDIVQMDMYSNGGFSMGMDQLESIALSFIPNIIAWVAGATYTGNLNKKTFWDRAAAKIPFLANVVEKKVDPYTGSKGSFIDTLNRVVPFFSIDTASQYEKNSKQLGLTKSQLTGKYSVNGEDFNVKGATLTAINQAYGQWNTADLEKFYNNQMSVKVKVGNSYKTLRYNQMTDDQRKNAVQSIMQNNAELAKIAAWLKAGNKYYASASIYTKLRQAGYTSNLYRGTQGFVSK